MKKLQTFVIVSLSLWVLAACSVSFNIHFDSNGGSDVPSIETSGTGTVRMPNDPVKEGYEFDGWYWDNHTFQQPFTANSLLDAPLSGHLTVYAKWRDPGEDPNSGLLRVRFMNAGDEAVDPIFVNPGSTIEPPVVSKEGHTLQGWYTSINQGQTLDQRWLFAINSVNSNLDLYPDWEVNWYTVRLEGDQLTTRRQNFGTTIFLPTEEKEEHRFLGWLDPISEDIHQDSYIIKYDTTLTPVFEPIMFYNIHFATGVDETIDSILIEEHLLVSSLPIPDPIRGRIFVGWTYEDVLLEAPFTYDFDQDITLDAVWELLTPYKIHFSMDDDVESRKVYFGEQVESFPTILHNEKILKGWTISGSATLLDLPYTFNREEDLILVPSWRDKEKYTISFEETVFDPITIIEGQKLDYLPKHLTPSSLYLTFGGWRVDDQLLELPLNYDFNRSITLSAIWLIKEEGMVFELREDQAILIGYEGDAKSITLPSIVHDYPIIRLAKEAFAGVSLEYLHIPITLTSMDENALKGADITRITTDFQAAPESWHTNFNPENLIIEYYRKKITLTFETGLSTGIEPIVGYAGDSIHAPTLPTTAYNFDGWYIDEDFTQRFFFNTMPNESMTLYAKWALPSPQQLPSLSFVFNNIGNFGSNENNYYELLPELVFDQMFELGFRTSGLGHGNVMDYNPNEMKVMLLTPESYRDYVSGFLGREVVDELKVNEFNFVIMGTMHIVVIYGDNGDKVYEMINAMEQDTIIRGFLDPLVATMSMRKGVTHAFGSNEFLDALPSTFEGDYGMLLEMFHGLWRQSHTMSEYIIIGLDNRFYVNYDEHITMFFGSRAFEIGQHYYFSFNDHKVLIIRERTSEDIIDRLKTIDPSIFESEAEPLGFTENSLSILGDQAFISGIENILEHSASYKTEDIGYMPLLDSAVTVLFDDGSDWRFRSVLEHHFPNEIFRSQSATVVEHEGRIIVVIRSSTVSQAISLFDNLPIDVLETIRELLGK